MCVCVCVCARANVALCIVGRHGGEHQFDVEAFKTSACQVACVLSADIFATPGPFNASLPDALRRSAADCASGIRFASRMRFAALHFDKENYISIEQLVSNLSISTTRRPWAFRTVENGRDSNSGRTWYSPSPGNQPGYQLPFSWDLNPACVRVSVDEKIRCVITAYLIACSWKSCARLITAVEGSRGQEYDWVISL